MIFLPGCPEILSSQFIGKKVFVDLNTCGGAVEKIKTFLFECGAYMTDFVDKNIDAIIVGQRLSRNELLTSVTTSHSRVGHIIKASREKAKYGSCSLEEIGKKWSIPLYDYKAILKVFYPAHQKQVKTRNIKMTQVKKLKAPFIKVEDRSHKYRPDFVEMKSVPKFDFDSPLPQSPFETWFKKNVPTNTKKLPLLAKTCELCYGKYSNLNTHLMSVQHTSAARDDSLFAGIDRLIARGTSFKQFKEKMEQKISVTDTLSSNLLSQ